MEKLHTNLAQSIERHPDKVHSVLITLNEGVDPHGLNLGVDKVLMGRILSVRLTGRQLKLLLTNDAIMAIESDEEMGIL